MNKKEKPDEAFVERPQEETQGGRARRISLKLDAEGAIDWSQLSEKQKDLFFETISSDPDVLEKIAGSLGEDGAVETPAGPVTAEHVKWFLTWYAKGEAIAIPWFIKSKSKGLIKIPPKVAEEIYSFDEKTLEDLSPNGAQFANEVVIPNLPEWMTRWITELGPGEKFIGGLLLHTAIKTTALVEWIKTQPQTVDAAGTATVPSPASSPTNGQAQPEGVQP